MKATSPDGSPARLIMATPRMRWALHVACAWLPADASLKAARRMRRAFGLDVIRDAADLAGTRGISVEHLVKGPALLVNVTEEARDLIVKLEAAPARKTQQGELPLPTGDRMELLAVLDAIEDGVTELDGVGVETDTVESWLP